MTTTRRALDQGFKSYGATLETTEAPFDPVGGTGDPNDSAVYLARPGIDFLRPWLAVRNGPAFQWPLGMEGFSLVIDPTLGTHKFIGDNAVTLDVLHAGEEHLTLSGSFPGASAPALLQALRDVVYRNAREEGKILYVPEIMSHAQRVQVNHAEFSRAETDRGRDLTYSVEFIRIGIVGSKITSAIPISPTPASANKGTASRSVSVDGIHNTLRKIAQWQTGDAAKWRTFYVANETYFAKKKIPLAKVPDKKLPIGLVIFY